MKICITRWLIATLLLLAPQIILAQLSEIEPNITKMLAGKNLRAGVALRDLTTGESVHLRADEHFSMLSVFKLPIAMAVLRDVDQGVWSLSDSLFIAKKHLNDDTWSPLRERYPHGNIYLTIDQLIRYTVSQSDNNGCDILLRLMGGPRSIESYMHDMGIMQIAISKTEAQMHRTWKGQYANHTTPLSMVELLSRFDSGDVVGCASQAYLWGVLAVTSTGSVRRRLPLDVVAAHKTGSSDRNADGLSAATNDVGILQFRDGRKVAYAIFISDSMESDEVNYNIIADIASLISNAYFAENE